MKLCSPKRLWEVNGSLHYQSLGTLVCNPSSRGVLVEEEVVVVVVVEAMVAGGNEPDPGDPSAVFDFPPEET